MLLQTAFSWTFVKYYACVILGSKMAFPANAKEENNRVSVYVIMYWKQIASLHLAHRCNFTSFDLQKMIASPPSHQYSNAT